MWITSSPKAAKAPTNIALGNFDGVHLGHQQVMAEILCAEKSLTSPKVNVQSVSSFHGDVIARGYSHWPDSGELGLVEQLSLLEQNSFTQPLAAPSLTAQLEQAVELPIDTWASGTASSGKPSSSAAPNEPQPYSTVVTFSPHPREYFSGVARPLLTPIAEKTWQLAQLGIQQLVMLPFNQALAELSAEDFVEHILIKGLQAKRISVGSDFHFGKGRSGNAEVLSEVAARHGVPVVQVPLKHLSGDRISSSRIRQALEEGNPAVAKQLLGRAYTLTGKVVQGQQLGRTIGFPTANLQVPVNKFLPRKGVYAVRVYGPSTTTIQGVMNIGNRPTVSGQSVSVEVHLLDNWTGDLYGQILTVSLEDFVRPEQKFESLDALKAQISQDCQVAIAALKP